MTKLHLSPREMEVCACVIAGMTNKEIADVLGCTVNTAKNHVKNAADRIRNYEPRITRTFARGVILSYHAMLSQKKEENPPAEHGIIIRS